MRELKILFEKNRRWAEGRLKQDPDYFKRLSEGQSPSYLWIGCSDSRIPANEVVGLAPGELFVHRNVANLFIHTDFNCLSVLQYAIDYLQIKHVIVCGHYCCGGIKAAMGDEALGLVDNWLRNIRDLYARSKDELEAIEDHQLRYNRLAELNVIQQVLNIGHTTVVQNGWARGQQISIHGWIYDLPKGRLIDLRCCVSSPKQLAPISHRLSDNSRTLSSHFVSQQGGAVLHEHCPHPAGRQSAATGERFVQRSGENWGLEEIYLTS